MSMYFPFLKIFPSLAVCPFLRLISQNYDHSLFGSHCLHLTVTVYGSIGKCGRLSQLPVQLAFGAH